MEKLITWRPDWQTVVIERQLKNWDRDSAPDSSRNARFQRAIAEGIKVTDWSEIQKKLRDLNREDVDVPSSMQVRLNSATSKSLDKIQETIKTTSSTELKRPRLAYVFKIILFNYLVSLQKDETAEEAETAQSVSVSRLDGVGLLRDVAELLLLDTDDAREKIQKIHRICQGGINNE